MATVNVDVTKRTNTLEIGVQGEKNAHTFLFDISSWIAEFGSGGTVTLDLRRPGEKESYTVGLTLADGIASWIVSDIDNAIAGDGRAQLNYVKGTGDAAKKVKSTQYVTIINRALDEQHGDVPDPYASYLDAARAIYSETYAAQLAAEHAQSEAQNYANSAGDAKTAAESAAEDAAESAQAAASVFAVVGNVAFSVLPNGQVRETWTKEEEE